MPRDWSIVHAERAALAEDLAPLEDQAWRTPSLCAGWTVREALAHLTAAASLSTMRWLVGVVQCRFDFDKQVDMRLREQLGGSPQETLDNFRRHTLSRKSSAGPFGALLGEIVVHSEDIRRPLGIDHTYPVELLVRAAEFYRRHDFTVPSRTMVRGLRLAATDSGFATGAGPLVTGPTLALVMVMAGRDRYVAELGGAGVEALRGRLPSVP